MSATTTSYSPQDYTIGWIAPLLFELAAAKAVLDEIHLPPQDFQQPLEDTNVYVYGRINHLNIVIASLKAGSYGTTGLTLAVTGMVRTFSNIRFGVLVGIGAGLPNRNPPVQLGDVVISRPEGKYPGMFQYDLQKAYGQSREHWQMIGRLGEPPTILLTALNHLLADQETQDNKILQIIDEVYQQLPKMKSRFARPDQAFGETHGNSSFESRHADQRLNQSFSASLQGSDGPVIHGGIIASGNTVIKNAGFRDSIASDVPGVVCFEMEAAGLPTDFPCIVIRGISDYADAEKHDGWQRYAALTAAACAKELLQYVPHQEVNRTRPAVIAVSAVPHHDESQTFRRLLSENCPSYVDDEEWKCNRTPGTCKWFINHWAYRHWIETEAKLLWLSSEPGRGKSVLCRYLIDEVLTTATEESCETNGPTVCYFFFRGDVDHPSTAANALCSLLNQLLNSQQGPLNDNLISKAMSMGKEFYRSIPNLWNALLLSASAATDANPVICIIDALDMCEETGRRELIQLLCHHARGTGLVKCPNLKFLVTSRPYRDIIRGFEEVKNTMPDIHLDGDGDAEVTWISQDIEIVIDHEIEGLSRLFLLSQDDCVRLDAYLRSSEHTTYLWVCLVLSKLKTSLSPMTSSLDLILSELGAPADDVFEELLRRVPNHVHAKSVLQIIVSAYRPLTVTEVSLALQTIGQGITLRSEQRLTEDEEWQMIREICGLFVTRINRMIYLIHEKAKDFLLPLTDKRGSTMEPSKTMSLKHSIELPAAHARMAKICMSYLKNDSAQTNDGFLGYARLSLYPHLYASDLDFQAEGIGLSLKFLDHELKRDWNLIVRHKPWYRTPDDEYCPRSEDTLLARVAYLGIASMMEFLLHRDIGDVNKLTGAGWSALHLAAFKGHVKVMSLLINARADINVLGRKSRAPIWAATEGKCEEAVQLLLARGCLVDGRDKEQPCSPLLCAVEGNDLSIARLLLKRRANTEFSTSRWSRSLRSISVRPAAPLAAAIKSGNYEMVELLLDYHTNVNADLSYGNTIAAPIALAIWHSTTDVVETLIARGAKINKKVSIGVQKEDFPLAVAAKANNHQACSLILGQWGVEIDAKHSNDGTALHQALVAWNYNIIKLLISQDAKFDARIVRQAFRKRHTLRKKDLDRGAVQVGSSADHNLELEDLIAIRLCLWHHAEMDYEMSQTAMVMCWQIKSLIIYVGQDRSRAKQYEQKYRLFYLAMDQGYYALAEAILLRGRSVEDISKSELDTLDALVLLSVVASDIDLLVKALNHNGSALNARHARSSRSAISLAFTYGKGFHGLDDEVSDETSFSFKEIARVLLQRGANPISVDGEGKTAMDWAELFRNPWYQEVISEPEVLSAWTRRPTNVVSSMHAVSRVRSRRPASEASSGGRDTLWEAAPPQRVDSKESTLDMTMGMSVWG